MNKDGTQGIDEAEFKDFFYEHMHKWHPDVKIAKDIFNKLKEPRRLLDSLQESIPSVEGISLQERSEGQTAVSQSQSVLTNVTAA